MRKKYNKKLSKSFLTVYDIEVKGLIKAYSKKRVLDGISFTVVKGSITGFIGPNGAGKTTTIKILSGLLRRDGGEVYVLGEDPWDNPRLKERVSVIFTKLPYPVNDTVEEYLNDLNSVFRGDVRKLVKDFNLKEHLKKRIGQLSSGQAQKIQLIASLLKNPELIIADEPTANLDPKARIEFYDLVKRLNKEFNATFFISSHILTELERVIDHVIFISNGRVIAEGELGKIEAMADSDEIVILTNDKERALEVLKEFNPIADGQYIRVKGKMRVILDLLDDNGVEVLSVRKVSLEDVFKKFTNI
jgi:ABC-2 type transport system ATP-binding protein